MARPRTEASEFVAFPIRLPKPLLDLIKEQAFDVGRPINTQIVRMLESDIKRIRKELKSPEVRRRMAGAV
jgi:hypothetical protein